MKIIICLWLVLLGCSQSYAQQGTKIATWNIEHLGKMGENVRGGTHGCGYGFSHRSNPQLKQIAGLISEREFAIVCIQEVMLDKNGECNQLETIRKELGGNWTVILPTFKDKVGGFTTGMSSMQTAYLFDSNKVRLDWSQILYYPAYRIQGSDLHDRPPLVARFTAMDNGTDKNDFVLVNLHLASGQQKRHNKAIAMSDIVKDVENLVLEQTFTESNGSVENDIVFLGDFNHDPWDVKTDHLDRFMTGGKYTRHKYYNLLDQSEKCTRMNKAFSSRIDHIYVSDGVMDHLIYDHAKLWLPDVDQNCENYAMYRETFSDHFPLYFLMTYDENAGE